MTERMAEDPLCASTHTERRFTCNVCVFIHVSNVAVICTRNDAKVIIFGIFCQFNWHAAYLQHATAGGGRVRAGGRHRCGPSNVGA